MHMSVTSVGGDEKPGQYVVVWGIMLLVLRVVVTTMFDLSPELLLRLDFRLLFENYVRDHNWLVSGLLSANLKPFVRELSNRQMCLNRF